MKKLRLMKEIDINGNIWYWIEHDGKKTSPYFTHDQEEKAREYFNNFKPIEPVKNVIAERDIQPVTDKTN